MSITLVQQLIKSMDKEGLTQEGLYTKQIHHRLGFCEIISVGKYIYSTVHLITCIWQLLVTLQVHIIKSKYK